MSSKLDRLRDHVARQYERRGLDRSRADRIAAAVDDQVDATVEAPPATPTPSGEDAAGDD